MISLLLTLFISLFSICPSVDRLEDQYENNVVESSYIVEKKAFTNQQYLYLTSYDLVNPANILATIDQLGNVAQLPTSSGFISGSTFVQSGGSLLFNTSAFLSGISVYRCDPSLGNNNLTSGSDFRVLSIEYVYQIYDSNHKDFTIIITTVNTNVNTNYVFSYRAFQITETFNGSLQSSWVSKITAFMGSNQIDGSNIVFLFNQNITYDYFRIGDDSYSSGYQNGYSVGFEDGRMDTQATYDEQVYNEGYQEGYAEGIQYATDTGSTASTIFNGIFDVGLLPVNVFLTIFNFEVFGINIAGIVSALLTLSVVIIIVRFLIGGKSDDK